MIQVELIDFDEPDWDTEDDEDFTVDDAADAGPAYGYQDGAYYIERNSAPGWAYSSSATNTPAPGRP